MIQKRDTRVAQVRTGAARAASRPTRFEDMVVRFIDRRYLRPQRRSWTGASTTSATIALTLLIGTVQGQALAARSEGPAGSSVGAVTAAPPPPSHPLARNPSCDTPAVEATMRSAAVPRYPDLARAAGVTGTVGIAVTLSPTGDIVATSIDSSSGSVPLDLAALEAARASTYTPRIVDCKAVPSTYIFKAIFDNQ